MRRTYPVFAAVLVVLAQLSTPSAQEALPGVYDFEAGGPGDRDGQWNGSPSSTLAPDTVVVHGGRMSARLQRDASSEQAFSSLAFGLKADRGGQSIELRGWLRSEDVDGWFGFYFRQDAATGVVAFENMESRGLSGTTDWTEYRITLPLRPEAHTIISGVLLVGTGTVWADDFSLWIDGRPLAEAPRAERLVTILDEDTEFTAGSGIALDALTGLQADNLALLGRVWGFLKYHHPAATGGRVHWDFELFRVMPGILAAPTADVARDSLTAWCDRLGPLAPCDPCAEPPFDPAQAPDIAWIRDEDLLGAALSARLVAAHGARPADGEQFYVGSTPYVNNPTFDHEPDYRVVAATDAGYRLLALFRFWNIVEYCSPNRDIIGEDWFGVLREFVPRLGVAAGDEAYKLAMLALVARLGDGHTQLGGAWSARPPGMGGQLPVHLRWVQGHPVVTGWADDALGPISGLRIGDAVLGVGDRPVDELLEEWRPYYSASNEPYRLRDLAQAVGRGPVGSCRLLVLRDGEQLTLDAERAALSDLDLQGGRFHTLDGPGFRVLEPGVAYMPLEKIKRDSVRDWIAAALAADAAGLVIDCRAYPSDFPLFELGGHLVAEDTPYVTFTRLDRANPGAFLWHDYRPLVPQQPHFARPVVVLVDESTVSSAEYHALAFRAAPQAVVMGSTTAGADGNVSRFPLPGGLTTAISGLGVYDDERNPTQRVGIVPDVVVEPTIAGIRAGRDEVLEAAVAEILGREATLEERGTW